MMSSQSMQTLIDPVFRSKMPLFDGTIAATGLSTAQNMSDFLGKQTLQYGGAYFSFDPRGKDGARLTPPWSNSKTSLLDGRNPVSHLSGMEGHNHIIYRQDSNSSEEGHSHSSSLHHAPVKQGFALYTKSPGISSPTAATSVAVRKQKTGGENSSPQPENSVYLAIPKPVYGHNPCCNDLGCVIGQQYSVEHGPSRIPNGVYEHEWMPTNAHYADRPPIQRKIQEALLQKRALQFEPSAEPLKRIPRTLPAMIEPNYSSYPYTLTRTLFGSLNEQGQRLQHSPRGYPSFYPSHPTYEHMTSEIYQEQSPMSKYGQLTQHPMFYYPQANVEIENRTQGKDIGSKQREDVSATRKHSTPREHYIVPPSLHGEIPLPLPGSETLPNHSFMRGFDYPCYALPRFHLNASQIGSPLKRQHGSPVVPSNRLDVSPSSQYIEHPITSATDPHPDKPSARLHVDPLHTNRAFQHLDQSSPARRTSQPAISPSSVESNRHFPPLTSPHIIRPVPPAAGLNMDRPLDYSPCKRQVRCLKQPKGTPISPGAWVPCSPHHNLDRIQPAAQNSQPTDGSKVRTIFYSPAAGNKHNGPVSNSETSVPKGCLKRSISHSASPIKIKEEDRDLCEVELIKKRQRVEMEKLQVENADVSPPMPVIDNVFSLAPYQAYLQASGLLFPGRVAQTLVQSAEQRELKTKPDIKEKEQERDKCHVVRQVSEEICVDTPTEKRGVEICEPKNIKVEKVDPSDTDYSAETPVSPRDYSKITVKKEPEETDSLDSGHMFVIKKCEPDELESKPSLTGENETSDESKHGEAAAQMNGSPQDDVCAPDKKVETPPLKSITPPQPPERKLDFKNIPPQCLKLSTYNIFLRDAKHYSLVPSTEKPPVQPTTECIPKLELQTPVRKHFFELHRSLHKLVSKSVSASSEQELRSWFSQLDLTERASPSTKAQKVSCLLGAKAREVWLNEEIKSALQKLLERLQEYTAQKRCPFPHVMRTGAVFVPMLVVKELLFPAVDGGFIDQVLQEHKVELRPTTLSEEKILIQLHKRACSSRLRRLMSLKHLPDIYADSVNLLYYTCVCKQLGLEMDDPATKEKDEECEETISCRTPDFCDITASPTSPAESHAAKRLTDKETKSDLSRNRTKSRVKSSSRRMFLDNSLSDEEAADDTEGGKVLNALGSQNWGGHQAEGAENGGSGHAKQDPSLVSQSPTSENSWMCPLTLDDIEESSSPGPVSQSSRASKSAVRSSNCSGVILKLRRMFSEGLTRKKARYQAISDSGTFADPPLSQTDDGEGEASGEAPKVTHRWQRTASFPRALRPRRSSSKKKLRSLLKIKYCPYLSACHSAEHRRRWVLRSAVQRARRAMRFYYPDLVGKRIRHLYEEDDKSEVWYRGEVLRIHEAHTNPLKTIFEVRYDSEPEWKYYLELLIDYKKGWLKIED